MWKLLFEKWFCKHKWKSHFKGEMFKETYYRTDIDTYLPTGIRKEYFREVLICEICGKIKRIEY